MHFDKMHFAMHFDKSKQGNNDPSVTLVQP